MGRNGDARVRTDDFVPGEVVRSLVQVVGSGACEAPEYEQHAAGKVRPQADAIGVAHRALERDASLKGARAPYAQGAQLACERLL